MILQPTLILTYLDSSPMVPTGSHRFPPCQAAVRQPQAIVLRHCCDRGASSTLLCPATCPGSWLGKAKQNIPMVGTSLELPRAILYILFFSVVLYLYNILLLIIVDSKSPMPGWLCIKLLLVAAAKLSHADFSIHINTPCVFWLPRTYDGSTSLLLAINSRLL